LGQSLEFSSEKESAAPLTSFRKLSRQQQLAFLQIKAGLSPAQIGLLAGEKHLDFSLAYHCIENAIGYFPIPLGIAQNFVIDDKPFLIPMAIEESSVIAAASKAAKWVALHGRLTTFTKGNLIIGQIQLPLVEQPDLVIQKIRQQKADWITVGNNLFPEMKRRGGGVKDIVTRKVSRVDGAGMSLVLHVLYDCQDAMGANHVTQICENLKPLVEFDTGQKVGICILSNLTDTKLFGAQIELNGISDAVAYGIVEATLFAKSDPYRAATHNKGVMNGIDAVALATGNDWRAIEAGVHSYASRHGGVQPVTNWWQEDLGEREENGDSPPDKQDRRLMGKIEIPLAVGIAGGMTKIHPMAQVSLQLLGVKSADELSRVIAAVGLVQNLAALLALSSGGIMKGHMSLHTSNLALAAGARGDEVGQVSDTLREMIAQDKPVNGHLARLLVQQLRLSELKKKEQLLLQTVQEAQDLILKRDPSA
jgi:hydroxymethylglutaryl-CoA reductase